MKIGVFGGVGSQTDFACAKFFTAEIEKVYFSSMHEVCEAVDDGKVQQAIIPVCNSHGGDVVEAKKALLDHPDVIVLEEANVEIPYHLAGKKKITLKQVKKVLCHWQGLLQAENFLKEKIPHAKKIKVESSAVAAKMVAEGIESYTVCICHHQTAVDNGLVFLANHIEPPGNTTTFVRIAKKV